ncbi:MYBPP protein, partial [Psilopogon haemacephalus]|nr:MYBPP protein [Psilopogon haemacephalus]
VRRKCLVPKRQPEEARREAHTLLEHPAFPREPREPLTFSGPGVFAGDGREEILPRHVLGSIQEFKREALARGNAQTTDFLGGSPPDITVVALKEEQEGEKNKKVHQIPPAEHKALQNWHHNMAVRKTLGKYLGEVLQRPENELLMSSSEDYRQTREEPVLLERPLPALLPGKGFRSGSAFWRQPERIGDELSGLTVALPRVERGCAGSLSRLREHRAGRQRAGLKPPKRIPFHPTRDKGHFLKHQHWELKSMEELHFYQLDLGGLDVISKGQPYTSGSAETFPGSITSAEDSDIHDSSSDSACVVPEGILGPSLVFCGQPARWISCTTSCKDEIGIAAQVTFEALVGEKAESSMMVSNDGTAAICYSWVRLPQQIPSRETKGKRMQRFYFDTRPGVILPGESRKFSFLFKSERVGIFSESWEFRTHPLLLGGALLQVTLWGIAVCEDKLADLREKLERDLAAQTVTAMVQEILKELLVQIQTPGRTPSPLGACATEEELFHQKNPMLHYQHRVVKQLHELWRQHMTFPPAFEEKVSLDQKRSVEDIQYQESPSEVLPAQSSTTKVPGWKDAHEEAPSEMMNAEEEERGPTEWNLSLEDFKQVVTSVPTRATLCFLSHQAIKTISKEELREAALSQLNEASLELCVEQRPTQTNLLYQTCLQLWREAVDGLVSHSLKLRSLLGLPEKDTYVDAVAEEAVEVKHPIKEGKEERVTTRKEERRSFGGKDKEGRKRTMKTAEKEKQEYPSGGKLKEEKKLKSSTSLQEVKEGTQPTEAATTDRAKPSWEQVDTVLLGTYQEKLYIEVYRLLDSTVSKMVSLFEELKEKGAL